jgi:hypothetical protein
MCARSFVKICKSISHLLSVNVWWSIPLQGETTFEGATMVSVWFVKDGNERTTGGPSYQMPLDDCIACLELSKGDYYSDLNNTPRFDHVRLQEFCGPRHVVVEIGELEATAKNWKPGFYLVRLTPREAQQRLELARFDPATFGYEIDELPGCFTSVS